MWHRAYDCVLEQEVLFRIIPHILPADNPQQAEHCSHMTGKGSRPCRRCKVGGSAVECEQENMYEQFFSGGPERTVDQTIRDVREQILVACLGVQDAVDQLQTKTGVKDKIAQYWIEQLISKARDMQSIRISHVETRDARLSNPLLKGDQRKAMKNTIKTEIQGELFQWLIEQPPSTYIGIPEGSGEICTNKILPGDHYNPLLDVPGLDVHQDTPCEILHTYLLGVDKYIWHKTNTEWDKKNEQLFAVRLRASTIDGLTITSMLDDFILRYPNSLLGKHFKILQQLAVFQLYDGVCPPLVFDLWKATGELGAILWFHTIANLDQYLEDLNIYVANLLDIWAMIDPNRIIVKQKLHVLVHLVENIRRHGPAVLYSTEIFECWNAIFRLCSVYSNHHGASLDIARRMAGIELFKHQVSGGWWSQQEPGNAAACATEINPQLSTYVRAGEHVRTFLQHHPALQRRLGWVSPLVLNPGTVKLTSSKKQSPSTWLTARGTNEIPTPTALSEPLDCIWYECKYLVSQSRDICKPDSWVFFRDRTGVSVESPHLQLCHAKHSILTCPKESRVVAIIDSYNIDSERDMYFNMPVLHRVCDPEGQGQSVQVTVDSISFVFNAQHHCRASGCTRLEDQHITQERRLTERIRDTLVHEPVDRYLLNTHALHNAALIREILPRKLTSPIAYVADREAHHQERSAAMRVAGPLKRAGAQAKAAETRARNKGMKDSIQKVPR
ncbi:hypothetical protein BC628DRAFT_1324557 [Trametes gibbosa]|nr:hypothetical protein BC628DRAFT_1324557 [Trametes gibbosa]